MPFGARISASPRWAMVSTFPPTPCGLASFAQALVTGLSTLGAEVDVVRVVDEPQPLVLAGVAHHLLNGAPDAAADAAAVLNGYDVVVLQHEYGIYGGADGRDVLDVLESLTVPVITVLHTVLADPTARQQQILQSIVRASDALVTMTHTAQHRVVDSYGADPTKVHVIPHGAADALVSATRPGPVHVREEPHRAPARPVEAARRPFILTWGLLGVGKGIEWGIEALSTLQDLDPSPVYIIAGQTHPRVLEREGEAYRQGLRAAAVAHGVSDDVVFDDRYLDAAQLHRLVRAADVVLLPYDSREQVTSGVLIEAVAAARPVVSSRFPHAVELLGDGAGLLVEQRDPAAIGAAVRRVLTEPGLAGRMTRRAEQLAPDLSWRAVAGRYLATGQALSRGQAVSSVAEPDGGTGMGALAVVA
jgi:glycosyltransferase involved in cell wall biosynthesis